MVTLGVRDLERATRFYRDGLGWPLHDSSVAGEVSFFDLGGTFVALWGRAELAADAGLEDDGRGFAGFALAHNVRDRAAVDEVLREVERAGGTIVKPAQDTFWGGYGGHFADPEGHLWEVTDNQVFSPAG
jgi:catechol 2,3-dioxygenase-like lactoylglutathione lyase family enzyme